MKKEFVCIVCPNSCRLTVEEKDGVISVSGNSCPRGEAHGRQEFISPQRMLTTTVSISGAEIRRLPVESSAGLPKEMLGQALKILYKLELKAPVKCGDIVYKNICGSGVDIRACRSLNRKG